MFYINFKKLRRYIEKDKATFPLAEESLYLFIFKPRYLVFQKQSFFYKSFLREILFEMFAESIKSSDTKIIAKIKITLLSIFNLSILKVASQHKSS